MKPIVIGSVNENAGKTSLIIGLGNYIGGKFRYVKPIGDRHVYKKKRLWDYDAGLVTSIFGMEEEPESMTIGFEHSKLRYMYSGDEIVEKLKEIVDTNGDETVLIEGGKNVRYGSSVYLDTIDLARALDARLVLVASSDGNTMMDDLRFIKDKVNMDDVDFRGIVINKVRSMEEFDTEIRPFIKDLGIDVLGVMPYMDELAQFNVGYIADKLFARVIAGESGLDATVKHVFVGAMSANSAIKDPLFMKENKLIITSGDRTDIILATLENHTVGIVLTNNILPPPIIIAKANEAGVPLLLVPFDTFEAAKRVDSMTPLVTKNDTDKINIISESVRANVDIERIIS